MASIVLGICGSIAAYKSCDLTRALVTQGHHVHCVLTRDALQFVAPLTLQTLSQQPVHTDLFDLTQEQRISHIALADTADLVLVAPATANILAKVAHGLCDDLLSTLICATRAPVMFAPAMNVHMWENPLVRKNVTILEAAQYRVLPPASGDLACGYQGEGRLPDTTQLLQYLEPILAQGKRSTATSAVGDTTVHIKKEAV